MTTIDNLTIRKNALGTHIYATLSSVKDNVIHGKKKDVTQECIMAVCSYLEDNGEQIIIDKQTGKVIGILRFKVI